MIRLYVTKEMVTIGVGTKLTYDVITIPENTVFTIRKREYRQYWWLEINNKKHSLSSYDYRILIKKCRKLPNTDMARAIYG